MATIDPPWRLDPLQTITDVHWGDEDSGGPAHWQLRSQYDFVAPTGFAPDGSGKLEGEVTTDPNFTGLTSPPASPWVFITGSFSWSHYEYVP